MTNNIFFNDNLEEEAYMELPQNFHSSQQIFGFFDPGFSNLILSFVLFSILQVLTSLLYLLIFAKLQILYLSTFWDAWIFHYYWEFKFHHIMMAIITLMLDMPLTFSLLKNWWIVLTFEFLMNQMLCSLLHVSLHLMILLFINSLLVVDILAYHSSKLCIRCSSC